LAPVIRQQILTDDGRNVGIESILA